MRMRPWYRVVIAGVVGAGMVSPAVAAVICTKKSGVMVVRDACKKKETQVNLADFGAVGPKGDPGAVGPKGDPGQDLTVDTPLQGGQTETGVYSATGNVSGGFSAFAIEFRPPLPADIDVANAEYKTGGATDSNCQGPGQAAAGHLCVYESAATSSGFLGFFKISASNGQLVEKPGVLMFWSLGGSQSRVWGTWAVTP